MQRPAIRAVVFDLGGVLADFGGVGRMRELAGIDSDEEVWQRWLACRWVRRFERGGCSGEEFAAGVVADWKLDISPEAFLDGFRSWIAAPLPGAEGLVAEVRARRPTGCLSNTNTVHWRQTASKWRLFDLFDFRVLSFEVGLVKPDAEVFEHLCRVAGVPPAGILFLDDNLPNVEAAATAGLVAAQARGVGEARRVLERHGVL